jgi:hypothetical protein
MMRRSRFVVGVVVAPDDVPADHAALILVTGVVGTIERKVPEGGTTPDQASRASPLSAT